MVVPLLLKKAKRNALLFSGLTLVLGGIVLFVKGEGTTAIQPSNEDKDKK